MLYIFSGLPGVGKSQLSRDLAQQIGAVYLRIDTIEQSLRDSGLSEIHGEGYELAYKLATENLKLGLSVIADSVNPIPLTREAWHQVASTAHTPSIDIEIICSNRSEHQYRVESRQSDIFGLKLPSWQKVCDRDYTPWKSDRILIDTAGQTPQKSLKVLQQALKFL